ncbi:MAG: NosR/NirI family nitrous oxide reductase transcriptional regulator [Myxococcota bacterium]|jgi:NosR/NirI family nitrous oxide reductase transcriptional regulator
MQRSLSSLALALLVGQLLVGQVRAEPASDAPVQLDCSGVLAADCAYVLASATRFEAVAGAAYVAGYDVDDTLVGWVIRSTDTVDIKAYSGKPLVTLVGLDPEALITGARVIHHSEPILLVGIPKKALTDFVDFYAGKPAVTKVVVGSSREADAVEVDVISGATVTALAQNQTILESARHLGVATGVIPPESINPGNFVTPAEGTPLPTWEQMVADGVFGHLTVRETEMGFVGSTDIFVDIWFTLADAPHIGKALLGKHEYAFQMSHLKPGDHLVVVLGNGTNSFKGSGFVRGGIFDRVRIEQGLRSVMFRDRDYTNFSSVKAVGAPDFKEGAVFITRGGRLDPGAAYDMVFVGSRYDGRGGFSRDFHAFKSTHRLPESVYVVTGGDRDLAGEIAAQAWYNQRYEVGVLIVFLLIVMLLFVARGWLTAKMPRLRVIHVSVMLVSFVVLGIVLQAQPSITQVLTLVGSAVYDFDVNLFLTEPVLFVFWIYIAVTLILWGRGLFCGWTCPYGSLSELLFKLGQKLKIPNYELPPKVHKYARFLRYVVLLALIPVFLVSPETGEKMAEIEPFKSTFFVPAWDREALYFIWWVVLIAPAIFWYRPFCRYICPLGAALSIPGSVRLSGPHRREFCSKCTICTKGCEPMAIRKDGSIDPRECLSCMECEANYNDAEVCPPLVAIERLRIGGAGKEDKLRKLHEDARKVPRSGNKKRAS